MVGAAAHRPPEVRHELVVAGGHDEPARPAHGLPERARALGGDHAVEAGGDEQHAIGVDAIGPGERVHRVGVGARAAREILGVPERTRLDAALAEAHHVAVLRVAQDLGEPAAGHHEEAGVHARLHAPAWSRRGCRRGSRRPSRCGLRRPPGVSRASRSGAARRSRSRRGRRRRRRNPRARARRPRRRASAAVRSRRSRSPDSRAPWRAPPTPRDCRRESETPARSRTGPAQPGAASAQGATPRPRPETRCGRRARPRGAAGRTARATRGSRPWSLRP